MIYHYIIFVTDSEGSRCPTAWQSRRVGSVIKSTIAADTLALLEAAEAGIFYSVLLSQVMGVPDGSIPVKCFVDNRSIVDPAHSTTAIEHKLLKSKCCSTAGSAVFWPNFKYRAGEIHSTTG